MENWENKWDEFKNVVLVEEIEQEAIHDQAVMDVLEYVQAHEEEVIQAFRNSEGSDTYPRDTVNTYELEMNAGGHELYYRGASWMDRDGGNEDGETQELTVDDQDCLHYGRFGKQTSTELQLEDYLSNLTADL